MKYILSLSVLLTSSLLAQSQSQWSGTGPIYYNGGSVGIGTQAPATKLHVSGGTLAVSVDDELSGFVQLWSNNAIIWKNGNGNGLKFGSATDLSATNWSEKMRITDAGNVGIGTTLPSVLLHVSKHSPSGSEIIIEGTGSGAQKAGIDFKSNGTTIGTTGFFPPWEFRMGSTIAGGSYFTSLYSGGNETMRLTNGNVGIGTTDPQAKLSVNGDILSRKVKVTQLGWADYVFHATYRLRPLSEVEQFIQQHHHLPEVPSAAEVEKDGIDLGDNQATLLKKIEELTLYIIEQNKRLSALEKKLQTNK